jgi:aspartyl protease family protein
MNRTLLIVAILIAITVLVAWVASTSSHTVGEAMGQPGFWTKAVILVAAVSSLVLRWQGSGSQALRYAAAWLAIFVALILAYSYKNDANDLYARFTGALNPAQPISEDGNAVTLRRSSDGHFYADTSINGTSLRLLADTGASAISLGAEDARRVGIDIEKLSYSITMSTANGTTQGAEVELDEVRVGQIVRRHVKAIVSPNMDGSVLGMSFFNTLSTFQIERDQLLLKD